MPYLDITIYGADWALLVLRICLATIFLAHGLSKFSMWKMAPSQSMSSSQLQLMRLLSVVEPLGALGVLLGVYTAWSAVALAVVMIGALYFKIMVWKKKFTGEGGWELDVILLGSALLIAATGPGIFSLALP